MNVLLLAAPFVLTSLAFAQGEEPAKTEAPAPKAGASAQGADASASWRLDVKFDAPRAVIMTTPTAGLRAVWYSTFTVTNKTGAARQIAPFVTVTTDTGKTVAATFSPRALRAVRLMAGEELVDLFDLAGSIDDGATKRGVAIFGTLDPFANRLELRAAGFASGLSRKGAEWAEQQVEYRAKFRRPGNEFHELSTLYAPTGDEWVTVERKKIR